MSNLGYGPGFFGIESWKQVPRCDVRSTILLEVYSDLYIKGDPGALDAFVDEVSASLPPGWRRDRAAEERRALRATPNDEAQSYIFKCEANSEQQAVDLFLVRFARRYEVTNIVPQKVGQLARSEYNAILDLFVDHAVRPVAERLGLAVEVTPDQLEITHWLTEDAANLLSRFSHLANKSSGSSHPLDSERWVAFLIQSHLDRVAYPYRPRLDTTTLERWLIEEEDWPEETARDLVLEFEFAQDLLAAYDSRQP